MALSGKKSSDKWFPVVMILAADSQTVKTGLAYDAVSVFISSEGTSGNDSLAEATITADDWKETKKAAGTSVGVYWLKIGSSEFPTEGKYQVIVEEDAGTCLPYRFVAEVRDNSEAEINNLIQNSARNNVY